MKITSTVEDYLLAIYILSSADGSAMAARLAKKVGVAPSTTTKMVQRLVRRELVTLTSRRAIQLTAAGRDLAETMVRRQRLAERFLTDVLGLDWADAHAEAHRFEHAMSASVEERLVQLLGNPATCPHGNPIPGPGASGRPNGTPLTEVALGRSVRILRISEEAEADRALLQFLKQQGLIPGALAEITGIARFNGLLTVRVQATRRDVPLGVATARRVMVDLVRPWPSDPSVRPTDPL